METNYFRRRRIDMGNRAVIHFQDSNVGMYVHWNGGRDTIEPMLEVAKEYKLYSGDYGLARLAQMFGNFVGGTLSMGIDELERLDCDNNNNGVYIIDSNFNIVDRQYMLGEEKSNYDPEEVKQAFRDTNDIYFKTKGE